MSNPVPLAYLRTDPESWSGQSRALLLCALAWVFFNRGGGRSWTESYAGSSHGAPFASVMRDLAIYRDMGLNQVPGERELRYAIEIACRACADVAADPTAGAVFFCPHWLEPLFADGLVATALIGPFVFFTLRVAAPERVDPDCGSHPACTRQHRSIEWTS